MAFAKNMWKFTYIKIPLAIVLVPILINCFHTDSFNPWSFLNAWTFVQAFVVAYLGLGILRIRNSNSDAFALLTMAALVALIFGLGSIYNFGNLYYLLSSEHIIAASIIFLLILGFGLYEMKRCDAVDTNSGTENPTIKWPSNEAPKVSIQAQEEEIVVND